MLVSNYVLLDPFNAITSGVSTYVASLRALIQEHKLLRSVKTHLIAKYPEESLEQFRRRVVLEIQELPREGLMVEAPETLHCTKYLPDSIPLHIRLHGSRQFGRWVQGLDVDNEHISAEQREISRACFLSAPSDAAQQAARIHFVLPQVVSCYPNPVPENQRLNSSLNSEITSEAPFDILFLGRWQPLKGTDTVLRISRAIPNLRLAVASTNKPRSLPKNVQFIAITNDLDRAAAFAKCRLILLPSLFETASMVGLEAIAASKPVATWTHLGLCEYAPAPLINHVPFGSDIELATSIQQILSANSDLSQLSQLHLDKIQELCAKSVTELLINGTQPHSAMPCPRPSQEVASTLSHIREAMMKSDSKTIAKRKLRKLFRDPIAYFRDSPIGRRFFPRYSRNKNERDESTVRLDPPPSSPVDLTPLEELKDAQRESLSPLIARIEVANKISILDPPKNPPGWTTTILYNAGDEDNIEQLCKSLYNFEDFAPFRRESLSLIQANIYPTEHVISILNRIDQKNKERLAKIANIIAIDPHPNLIQSLRCCGPFIKTVVVLTLEPEEDGYIESMLSDAIITTYQPKLEYKFAKRFNQTKDWAELPLVLRKVIQEIGPKTPDMLLPLIGVIEYHSEYFDFNASRFQGIIYLRNDVKGPHTSFRSYLQEFSEYVDKMLVLDSVYMRYRSLCENVEAGESPATLVEACLNDGVLFEIRYVA